MANLIWYIWQSHGTVKTVPYIAFYNGHQTIFSLHLTRRGARRFAANDSLEILYAEPVIRDDASIVPYRWFAGWRQRIWCFPRRDEDIPPYSILVGCCQHILNHFVGNGLDRSASLIIQTSFLYGAHRHHSRQNPTENVPRGTFPGDFLCFWGLGLPQKGLLCYNR